MRKVGIFMDDKRLDVMSLVKDEYIVETAPKTFFLQEEIKSKKIYEIGCVCGNYSNCV